MLIKLTDHHSQVKSSWLKTVPLGQRKEMGRSVCSLSCTHTWYTWHLVSGSA